MKNRVINLAFLDLNDGESLMSFYHLLLKDKNLHSYFYLKDNHFYIHAFVYKQIREKTLKNFAENPPYDEWGMLPFLDEIIGVDWIIDVNEYGFADDEEGRIIRVMDKKVSKGIFKDPRDVDSTPKTRWEFHTSTRGAIES